MLNIKTISMALLSAAVLTACGGGSTGDGADTDARTKYVGSWQADCSFAMFVSGSVPRYEKEQIDIRLEGASDLAITSTEYLYLDTACTQPATDETGYTTNATMTFFGSTKTLADGKVVDKVRAALPDLEPNTTVPAILYTSDNKIYAQINDPDDPVPVDSEGFPEALDLSDYLTKLNN